MENPNPKPTRAERKGPADTQPLQVPEELRKGPTAHTTGKFSSEEIQARLEQGRVEVERTQEGSALRVRHHHAPPQERRSAARGANLPHGFPDRRAFTPLQVPLLFPESGPILVLLIGGFADDRAMGEALPFWGDDQDGGSLLWQALGRSGLVHRKDAGQALGQGGFWEERPPRTQGLAMTYIGFRRRGEPADFEQVIKSWNLKRMQVLIQECDERSMGRLKVVTVGEPARFMTCASMFGLPGIPLLSLPDPTRDVLGTTKRPEPEARERWIEWAADLLRVERRLLED
ncbi:MAG: hypothetical protein HY823_09140 [Acidobacteria bacterium]|nr:hypothetical protein [Acidobacteriota bacterium]